eukprot:COSAG02_NODE_38662_length_426_cov_1.250765_1_plen_86_part_01
MLVGLFALPMLYAFVKCCSGCCSKNAAGEQLLQQPFDPRQSHVHLEEQSTKLLGWCSKEYLKILKAATFPGIKILITYAQVTGQLS